MATEEQKKANLVRVYKMMVEGFAKGLWDLLGEGAYASMVTFGDELVEIMQKEMGLELGGENVEEVLSEVARLAVDEFGFADKVEIVESSETHAVINVEGYDGFNLVKKLEALGIEPYVCPIMNTMSGALRKNLGKRVHQQIEVQPKVRGLKITLTAEE